jgi:hypothetical protein
MFCIDGDKIIPIRTNSPVLFMLSEILHFVQQNKNEPHKTIVNIRSVGIDVTIHKKMNAR